MDTRIYFAKAMTHLENLEKNIGSLKGKKILDLGSGGGDFLIECAKRSYDVVGLEYAKHKIPVSLQNAKDAGVQISVVQGKAEEAPFPDSSFDFINASELIEHVKDPGAVLAEVYRLLKPGGKAYVSVHNRFGFRDAHFKTYGLNWMPRKMGENFLSLLKKHKKYHEQSGFQRISQMHYYTFGGFRGLAEGRGLFATDMRQNKLQKETWRWHILARFAYRLLRLFYFNTYHILLTKTGSISQWRG